MSAFAEFLRDPWRLRAVLCQNVEIANMPGYDDGDVIDVFVWFVGRTLEDEWIAHGISDHFDPHAADSILASIDGEHMDIMLSYGGVEWDEMEDMEAEFAVIQRALVASIHPKLFETLRALSHSEIRDLRAAEDAESRARRVQRG